MGDGMHDNSCCGVCDFCKQYHHNPYTSAGTVELTVPQALAPLLESATIRTPGGLLVPTTDTVGRINERRRRDAARWN